jgi:dipeptidyl aminopeptidase/acylaminoacyl peptidase
MFGRLRFRDSSLYLCAVIAGLALVLVAAGPSWAEPERVVKPNYPQALKYNQDFLRQYVYSTSVDPQWIGKNDVFWYSYRTRNGTNYWKVNPKYGTKEPLFDRVKLATALSEATKKPQEPQALNLGRARVNDEGTKLTFVAEEYQYEWDLNTEKLTKGARAPRAPTPPGFENMSEEQRQRFQEMRDRFQRRDRDQQEERREEQQQQQQEEQQQRQDQQQDQQQQQQDQQQQQQQQDQQRRGRFGLGDRGFGGPPRGPRDYRSFSPDRKAYLFVRQHNLYLAEMDDKALTRLMLPTFSDDFAGALAQAWSVTRGTSLARELHATQLTTDGAEEYSFVSMATFGSGMDDGINPPRVEWSRDSKSFHATRVDSRGVQELFVVNSLSNPRPALEKYKYPMPGEEAVRRMELFVGDRAGKKLTRVKPKWKDESYSNIQWGKTSDEVRFVRRDRLQRNIELCTINVHTGECKCLVVEGFENAQIDFQAPRYIDETDEMIWWSERSGWGHFYLYGRDGKLKNAITSGLYRASRIVAVDPTKRLLYFTANGREPGENIYYDHLYCVGLDGTGLTLLTPGNATHRASLSPTRQYLVDNCSRVDVAPIACLRDATGKELMKLEEADLSRLQEIGWKMPETFVVKAADGVTDLYGNMWKPFHFDSSKKYPIIANVYPGPQTEGVTATFSATSTPQQLAQLGFIVIQVGHRGGTPNRSKAYGSYGYNNLRDYGLADKKSAIEQLAARYSFIDIDRVGIYGHSGGGFMSAAAVLQKPYNEFFKAAVASAGNHDNNIYNNGWAERYHGMKEVAVNDAKTNEAQRTTTNTATGRRTRSGFGSTGNSNGNGGADTGSNANQVQTQSLDASKNTEAKEATRFEIKVPTNAELAGNLKGALLLVHGEVDNNVHPANTMRLVDALIKANKRFDMLILPGKRHGFGDYQPYFNQRMWEFFAEHLMGDRQTGADILEKR